MGLTLGQPAAVVITVFTFLGVGLAFPYVLLSFYPQLENILPRPGRWMESLKQFLAFPLLATVIWLMWIYGLETRLEGELYLWIALLLASLAAWQLGRWPGRSLGLLSFVILLGVSLWLSYAGTALRTATSATGANGATGNGASSSASGGAWEKYSNSRLEELLKAKRPVFVDFTAAWCVTCKVNEHLALEQTEVVDRFKTMGVRMLRGDWTNGDPEITQALSRFGRNGVPLYLLYSGKNGDIPRVLPQILTASGVLKELNAIAR